MVKMDGSGRCSLRNRKFLRKIQPVMSMSGPGSRRHHIPARCAVPGYPPLAPVPTTPLSVRRPSSTPPVDPEVPVALTQSEGLACAASPGSSPRTMRSRSPDRGPFPSPQSPQIPSGSIQAGEQSSHGSDPSPVSSPECSSSSQHSTLDVASVARSGAGDSPSSPGSPPSPPSFPTCVPRRSNRCRGPPKTFSPQLHGAYHRVRRDSGL